jgi:GTPase SAR1 family protein
MNYNQEKSLSEGQNIMALSNMTQTQIDSFNEFILGKSPTVREAFSPKLYFMYNLIHENLKKSDPFTYDTIGTEGFRTLIMYKNTKGIYVITLYFDEFESYYVLEEFTQ